jgi:phage tail-like protein
MRENAVIKLPGLARYPDVTLKRGLIGSLALYEWIDQIRAGNPKGLRTVTIQLLDEERSAVVTSWKLLRARVVRHTSGPFNARGSDVALEELVLAHERLEME